jgi:hypothetical protein
VNLTKRERKRSKLIKIRGEKWNITTRINEIQRTIKEYFKNLYSNKLENLTKMDKFLEAHALHLYSTYFRIPRQSNKIGRKNKTN